MDELDYSEIADASTGLSADLNSIVASLRMVGADKFDPARFHYIEVLAKRAISHQGRVKLLLDSKLSLALDAFKERFDQAQIDAKETIARGAQQYPHAANDMQRLFVAGDFKALQRLILTLKSREQCASLSALVLQLEQHSHESPETNFPVTGRLRPELKTIRNFRNTWAKLSVDKQVSKALEQAPTNAGPINSHMLVLRSLELMRDISPDYLNRFMSYVDTLLCFDQCDKEKAVAPKKRQAAKAAKK